MQEILIRSISFFCNLLYVVMLIRVILSWFPALRGNQLVNVLFAFTDPILNPIRRLVQRSPLGGPGMMLDFSPVIAFFLIQFAEVLLVGIIRQVM